MNGKVMNFCGLWRSVAAARGFFAGALLVSGMMLAASSALAAPDGKSAPEIKDVAVVEKKGRLLAFVSLGSAFSPKVFEALHSGVTTRFTYELALMRDRAVLFDIEMDRQTLTHQVKFDALKKAYTFISQNGLDEKIEKVTKDRKKMMDWMAEINGHAIAKTRALDPKARYYLQVRANLNSVKFAFPFNYMLSFLNSKTPWAASPPFGSRGM
jgi:Zn-dependent membrane protease YugP